MAHLRRRQAGRVGGIVIRCLSDLIDARESHSREADGGETLHHLEIPEDVDVQEALEFPHPKRRAHGGETPLASAVSESLDEDWEAQDILPTDYSHGYDEELTTSPSDDEDEIREEIISAIPRITVEEISEQPLIELMPSKFTPNRYTRHPQSWV